MNDLSPHANNRSDTVDGIEKPTDLLLQLNQRLLRLSEQVDNLQQDIDAMSAVVDDSGTQVTALVGELTETQSAAQLQKRLAELTEQMNAEHEQLNYLGLKMTETATREQMVRLAGTVATENQVNSVLELVQQMARSLELSNRYTETREEHIEALTSTLREIVTKRQAKHDQSAFRGPYVETIQSSAKAELLTGLLPLVDGLDVARKQAEAIVAKEQATAEEVRRQALAAEEQASGGLLNKFRGRNSTESTNGRAANRATEGPASSAERLLQQIVTLQERIETVLSLEGVICIDTTDATYDPRIHIAVETEFTNDAEVGAILCELRPGYAQGDRVLRYAEVVVAAAPNDVLS